MRYPPEHKQHTHRQILAAAARRFKAGGFDATGVAAVMQDADLTHGGFYTHFRSKEDLVCAVIRSGFDDVSARFESQFDHLSGDEWLRAWVTAYLSPTHARHTAEGCPLPALTGEIARAGDEARAAFTDMCAARVARVSREVNAPPAEAERRVLAAVAQMAGALMLARAVTGPLSARVLSAARDEAIATLTSPAGRRDPSPQEHPS